MVFGFDLLPARSVATAVARNRPPFAMRFASFADRSTLRTVPVTPESLRPTLTLRRQRLPVARFLAFPQRLPERTPPTSRSTATVGEADSEIRSTKKPGLRTTLA